MTQDQEFQAVYCRWARNEFGIEDAVSVEFVFEDAKAWSEWTFEDASLLAAITTADGKKIEKTVEFDNDLIAGILRAEISLRKENA